MATLRIPCATGLALALALVAPGFQSVAETGDPQLSPSFVVILGEGHGWSSTSVPMDDAVPASKSDLARTPALERLAREGMRFACAYAPLPRCTPTRAALFTGRNPAPMHMTFVGEGKGDTGGADAGRKMIPPHCVLELPAGEVTIGSLLKGAGYATAHFGKWHVGRVSPTRHGFDETDGANDNRGPENVENPNPRQAFALTERGLDFMARQAKAGRPFFLQMSHYAGKGPVDVRPETWEAVLKRAGGAADDERNAKRIGSAAVMEDMDATIDSILKKIDELGIAGGTYVLYTADHGTPGRNPPLTGGKGTLGEGGLRVPLIVRGPGIKAGACSHTRAILTDLLPTFAALARVKEPLPKGLDGGSLVPVLMNGGDGAVQRPREELVFHYPHYDHDNDGPASALLLGPFKLLKVYETDAVHLYDLSKDLAEQHDLAKEMPEKVVELARKLDEDLKAMDAQMATPNPSYDPSQASDTRRGGGQKKNRKGAP
jgi:arylsulfatase A